MCGKESTQAVGGLPTLLGPELPSREPVKKPKIPADREQPTLLVPSAVRSPGNLRRKRSTFSLMSEQLMSGTGQGMAALQREEGTFGRTTGCAHWGHSREYQARDRWAVSEFLPNHVDGISKTRQGGLLSCFMPYRAKSGNMQRRD